MATPLSPTRVKLLGIIMILGVCLILSYGVISDTSYGDRYFGSVRQFLNNSSSIWGIFSIEEDNEDYDLYRLWVGNFDRYCNSSALFERASVKERAETMVVNYNPPCQDQDEALVDTEELFDLLYASQNPENCNTANLAVFKFFDRGVGSDMHYLAYALLVAYHSNRTLILEPHTWRFTDPLACPEQNLECYFLPLSKCNWENSGITVDASSIPDFTEQTSRRLVRIVNSDLVRAKSLRYQVPPMFSRRRNTEWIWSIAVGYVMRLNERTRELVEQQILELGLDNEENHPIISMHVRRGDKVQFKEADSFELSDYIRHAEKVREIHQAETIFLLSDDAEVVREASNLTGWKILFQDAIRRKGGFQHGWMDNSDDEKGEIVMSVIYDIFLGAQGDFFIGTFSSNFGRLVWEIMLVQHGGIVPGYASLDRPWLPRPP